MNSDIKATIGMTKTMSCLMEQGLECFVPIHDKGAFDLVVYDKTRDVFYKVQVKYRSSTKGAIKVEYRKMINNRRTLKYNLYDDKEVDVFAIYCPETDECYFIKNDSRERISLRIKPPIKETVKNLLYAKDFRLFPK